MILYVLREKIIINCMSFEWLTHRITGSRDYAEADGARARVVGGDTSRQEPKPYDGQTPPRPQRWSVFLADSDSFNYGGRGDGGEPESLDTR